VEIALTKVTQLESLTALGPLVDRLVALESGAPRGHRSEGGGSAASPDSPEIPAVSSGPGIALDANVEQLQKKASAPESPSASVAPASAPSPPIPVSTTPPAEPHTAATRVAAVATTTSAAPPQPASSLTLSAAGREPSPPSAGGELPALDIGMARKVWPDLVKKVPSKLKWRLSQVEPIAVVGTDVLIIAAKSGFNSQAVEEDCGTPEVLGQLEKGLQKLIHRPVTIKYERTNGPNGTAPDASQADARGPDALMADPMLQKVVELFEARPLQLEYEDLDPAPQA
jgi:DNA polymerase III subunit gamma/tau